MLQEKRNDWKMYTGVGVVGTGMKKTCLIYK